MSRSVAISLIGLALGAVLGYHLKSAPPTAAVPVSSAPINLSALPKTPEIGTEKCTAPFDPGPALAGGSLALAEFEAWLATASCDEVMREILDPAVNGYPGSSPVIALLVRRFRDFSVDARFATLHKHLTDGKKIYSLELLPILSDLAKATLPRRADEMQKLFKNGNQWDQTGIAIALQEWAAMDLPAALAFAGKVEKNHSGLIASLVLVQMGETNMERALQETLKLSTPEGRSVALEGLAKRMGQDDLAVALDWLGQHGLSPSNAASAAIRTAAAKDGASAAQLILDRPGFFEGEAGSKYVEDIFQTWAKRDPDAAAAWLEAHPLSERPRKAAEKALAETRWQSLSLDDALAEYPNLPDAIRKTNERGLADRLLAEDAEHAAERLISILPDSEKTGATVMKLLDQLPDSYLPDALGFLPHLAEVMKSNHNLAFRISLMPSSTLEELLPDEVRGLVQSQVLDMASRSDPERAIAMIETMDPAKVSPSVFNDIAATLGQSDPQKAADWIQGFEEGPNKEWAAVNLVANWAKYDPDGATAWLKTLPPGLTRDHATVEAASMRALTGDHQSALTLAAGIADPVNRTEATGRALQQYWKQNPDAASTALSNSGLPAAQQTTVAKKLGKGDYRN